MDTELEILKLVAERLEKAGFDYMLSGSVALACYGQARMKHAIDIVIDLRPSDAERFAALFQGDFYCDVEHVRAAARRVGLFNMVHLKKLIRVDLYIRGNSEFRREEFGRRRRLPIGGFEIWVVALEDLILSKLLWARNSRSEFQRRDARELLGFSSGLDDAYLERWAKSLDLEPLLAEARA